MELMKLIFDTLYSWNGINLTVAIIGIFIGIYERKKKIRYIIAQSDDKSKSVFAFWNASSRTILEEDIYLLYAYGGKQCTHSVYFSSDDEVPLDINIQKRFQHQLEPRVGNRFDFKFNYLLPNHGFIIVFTNPVDEDEFIKPLKVIGRIRGQQKDDFKYNYFTHSKTDWRNYNNGYVKIKEDKFIASIIIICLFSVPMVLFLIYSLVIKIVSSINSNNLSIEMFLSMIIIIFTLYCIIKFVIRSLMPYKLRRNYKQATETYNCKNISILD